MIFYGTKSDILREMNFIVPCYHNAYDNMKITSSLRFLYIFGGSGLLCAAAVAHSTTARILVASLQTVLFGELLVVLGSDLRI